MPFYKTGWTRNNHNISDACSPYANNGLKEVHNKGVLTTMHPQCDYATRFLKDRKYSNVIFKVQHTEYPILRKLE